MAGRGWLPENRPRLRSYQDEPEGQPVLTMGFGLPIFHTVREISSASTRAQDLKTGRAFKPPQQGSTIDVERLQSWAVPFIRNLASLLILGLLAVWLVPAQLSWAGEQARTSPWRALLNGLLVVFLGWIIALLVRAMILILALFFYWVSLPNLGFLVGTLGLTGLGLLLSIFWLSIVYFSKLIVAFLVGSLLIKRLKPGTLPRRIWPLLIGVTLYALLASIPYLGWLVATLTTFIGLGALWMVVRPPRLVEGVLAASLQPAGEGLDVTPAT
jgi:hypothetical protein